MADNVTFQSATPATPASGETIAADDAGVNGKVQIIKLAISADGSAAVIPADETNGIFVDVKRLPAGDNNIGNVDVVTLPALPAGTNNIGDVDVLSLPALPAGTNNIGDVDIASALPAGTNNIGDVDVASMPTLSIFRSLDLDETEEDVKTSAGQVHGWYIVNRSTSPRYIKFYNDVAANVVVGTTTPVMTLEIPGNASDHVAANVLGAMGLNFNTAICVAATTGLADSDTGAPAANDVLVNIFYK